MSAAVVIGILALLIVLVLGGFFGYKYIYAKNKCTNSDPDTTNNIQSFIWNSGSLFSLSGNCVANTCITGFGDASNKPINGLCPKQAVTTYTASTVVGSCTGATAKAITGISTSAACGDACTTDTTCVGYDWNSTVCNTYPSPAAAPTNTGTAGVTCSMKNK